jgi:hypothetical protein
MQLINAYAHITSSEDKNNNKGFITTFEAQKLSQDNVKLDHKRGRSWAVSVGQKCLDKELVCISPSKVYINYILQYQLLQLFELISYFQCMIDIRPSI